MEVSSALSSLGQAHLSHLPQRPPIHLGFQDLSYTVSNGKSSKLILREISGEFRSGQLTAILGPSGAGKSTLLNILAGYRVDGATGLITTNGEPRNLRLFRKLSRYIMQEDLLQPLITVQEAMEMAADLKLGSDVRKQMKEVIEAMEVLKTTVFLGITIDAKLQWVPHIAILSSELSSAAYAIKKIRSLTDETTAKKELFVQFTIWALDILYEIYLSKSMYSRSPIEEIIQLLRLNKARHTSSELLSGGERKRLSIALELVNNPPVVFLDEPTTGLDDVASSTCVSLLKRVARGGRTVVCSLHTPSARLFAMFDHVYVVAAGRCAYQGASGGVVPFLNELALPCPRTYNPADFVIEVSSGEYGLHVDKMVTAVDNGRSHKWRHYLIETDYQEMEIEQLNTGVVEDHIYRYESTAYQQFHVLLRRMWLQTVRNRGYLWLRVVLHLFLGALVASTFRQIGYDATKALFNFGFCYITVIFMLYIPMMPVLLAFPSEVLLVKREYFNRWYGLKPYYAALVVSRTPVTVFFCLLYLCIVYPLTSQPMEPNRLMMFMTICVMIALISESMGTLISSNLSVVNSMFMGPVAAVPLMMLAVYGFGSGDAAPAPVWRLARACSFLRYGMEGLLAAVYGGSRRDLDCPDDVVYCEYQNVRYFLKLMGMSGVSFWLDFGVLILMLFGMNLGAYYLLNQRLSRNHAFKSIKVIRNLIKTKLRV